MLEHRIREALLPFAGAMPMERFDAMVAAAVRAAREDRIPEVYRTGRVAEPAFPNASHCTPPRIDWLGLGSGFVIFVGLAAAVWFA